MAKKVRCKVCANEDKNHCKIKKVTIRPNKPRKCEAFIFEESKVKAKQEIRSVRVNYRDAERQRRERKEKLKELRRLIKQKPKNGTAKDLGLIQPEKGRIIMPGDPGFSMPGKDSKHPLTGDLSRFITTAKKEDKE